MRVPTHRCTTHLFTGFRSGMMMLLCSLTFLGTTLAQPKSKSNKAVRIIARRNDSTVSLRWAPTNSVIFELGKTNGYRVERAELRGGAPGPFTLVNANHPVIPWPMGGWHWFLSKMGPADSTRMMYLHIGYSMLFSDSANKASDQSAEDKSASLESQYSYAMLAADRDSMAAVGLGLRFEDYLIDAGVPYLYRITVLGDIPAGMNPTDTVSVGGESFKHLFQSSLRAEELESAITIFWNKIPDFTAHHVMRSDDGGKTYQSLNSAPIITLITGDSAQSNSEFYSDTALTNYKVYHYRIFGYNSFGSEELIGHIQAMPRDRTAPQMPTEVHADNIGVGKVKITWQMNEPVDKDLAGFHIGRDTVDEGDSTSFRHITKRMLPPSARELIDESGGFADKNFYIVEAYDTARNMVRSFSAYCVMIDSTPPEPPVLVKGSIDTNGIVTINFTPPKDRDYRGYRLLRANDSTHEFSVIRERFTDSSVNVSRETVLTDTIEIRTLTHYIYYKMYAIDFHYNESHTSNMLQVKRPDVVPPVAAVITGYLVTDSNVVIEFVPSSSDDVAYHKLLRKRSSVEQWDSIAMTTVATGKFIDRSGAVNDEYDYAFQTADESGLFSELSNIITAKRYDNGLRPGVRNLRGTYDAGKKEVTLNWDYDNSSEPFTYLIYRTETSKLTTYARLADSKSRTFVDKRPPGASSILYSVKVVTDSGAESKLVDPVTIKLR
ncbi:MAG: hypothetical protein WCH46_10745 [bacterium]